MALATLNTDGSLKWLPGAVALPLPDNGQQIQWGSNAQQLGRGASKLSLDGGTGNVNIPGALTVGGAGTGVLTLGGSLTSGHVVGVSIDHAIILRGDTTTANMNYMITPGDTCCFIEYGGRWVFRRINPGLNENLFEINTANVFYKSVALQRIPYVSCRVDGPTVSNRGGQVIPSSTVGASGQYDLTITPPHPAGANLVPQVTLIGEHGYVLVNPSGNGEYLQIKIANVAIAPSTLSFYLVIL
jgi:hypothetical protein